MEHRRGVRLDADPVTGLEVGEVQGGHRGDQGGAGGLVAADLDAVPGAPLVVGRVYHADRQPQHPPLDLRQRLQVDGRARGHGGLRSHSQLSHTQPPRRSTAALRVSPASPRRDRDQPHGLPQITPVIWPNGPGMGSTSVRDSRAGPGITPPPDLRRSSRSCPRPAVRRAADQFLRVAPGTLRAGRKAGQDRGETPHRADGERRGQAAQRGERADAGERSRRADRQSPSPPSRWKGSTRWSRSTGSIRMSRC